MSKITSGIHHVGLTVDNLEQSAAFFTELLGWAEVMRRDYPAIFVSDGSHMITLWQIRKPAVSFDKDHNIGLHHIAFKIEDEETLQQLYNTLKQNGIDIEFAPEPLGNGPARHMMCYEPSGNRVEFIWPGE